MSGLIERDQPEQREKCKGGAESRTDGGEGLTGCTSEALGARKLGRGRFGRRRVSLMERGIHPRYGSGKPITGSALWRRAEAFLKAARFHWIIRHAALPVASAIAARASR
jgi:hypothetical protein